MQRKLTLELKIDFIDDEKHQCMIKAWRGLMLTIYAQANLMADPNMPKPEVMGVSDDFYTEVKAVDMFLDINDKGVMVETHTTPDEQEISDELQKAFASV